MLDKNRKPITDLEITIEKNKSNLNLLRIPDNGYYLQDRSLSQSDAVDLIYWSLVVLKSRCKDTACMVAYDKMFTKVAQITKDKYKNIIFELLSILFLVLDFKIN